ncbi:unnamed protein product [Leptosia nina]|uniref:Endonuclease-reverse transcriptase n=1 Tax=Leptosia nina TaxID=320188 RepID=A0AAV1K4T3_9NEOP
MDEVLLSLRRIQEELVEHKNMIQQNADKITEQVTQNINQLMDKKLQVYDTKLEKLKERVENQDKRLFYLEKEARQRNLVFFGIEEDEKSYLSMEIKMKDFIRKYLSINIDSRDMQIIKRIGKKGNNPRPVVITFATLGTKISILKQKLGLRDTTYYIKEDFPLQVLNKRRELQEQLKLERERGKRAILKYDKLIILEPVGSSTNTGNKKRNHSNSPEEKNTQTGSHSVKKNKTLARHTPLRSSSFTEGIAKPGILNFLINKNTNANTSLSSEIDDKTK